MIKPMRRAFLPGAIVLLIMSAGNPAHGAETPPDSNFNKTSMLKGYQLQPGSKTVRATTTLALRVAICYPQTVGEDDLQPLAYTCDGVDEGELVASVMIDDWSVNGIAGGNSAVGTIVGSGAGATYTAPSRTPSPNTVAVSVKADPGRGSTPSLLVSNIRIVDLTKFSGTVKFSSEAMQGQVEVTDGSAEVTWALVEDLPDVRSYKASGSISFSLAPVLEDVECTPVRITDSIDTSNKLVVYTDRANWNPNTYGFTLTAADTETAALTTECTDEDGDSFPMTFPKFLVLGVGGPCVPDINPNPIPFTDETLLQGKFGCPVGMFFPGLDASWEFTSD